MSMDFDLPINLVNLCVPPKPAETPRFISGCPNFAVSEQIIKSHIIANSHPPPRAYPDTAAIIGFLIARILLEASVNISPMKASTKFLFAIMEISAPAANAFSEPVKTMQRTFSFFWACSNASASSSRSASFKAFKASGLFRVTTQMWSSTSTIIVS